MPPQAKKTTQDFALPPRGEAIAHPAGSERPAAPSRKKPRRVRGVTPMEHGRGLARFAEFRIPRVDPGLDAAAEHLHVREAETGVLGRLTDGRRVFRSSSVEDDLALPAQARGTEATLADDASVSKS